MIIHVPHLKSAPERAQGTCTFCGKDAKDPGECLERRAGWLRAAGLDRDASHDDILGAWDDGLLSEGQTCDLLRVNRIQVRDLLIEFNGKPRLRPILNPAPAWKQAFEAAPRGDCQQEILLQELHRRDAQPDWHSQYLDAKAALNNALQALEIVPILRADIENLEHQLAALRAELDRKEFELDREEYCSDTLRPDARIEPAPRCQKCNRLIENCLSAQECKRFIALPQDPETGLRFDVATPCAHPDPQLFAARMADLRDHGAAHIALEIEDHMATVGDLFGCVMVEKTKVTGGLTMVGGAALARLQNIDAILTDLFDELIEPGSKANNE